MALNDRLGAHLATFCALLPIAGPPGALRAEIESWPVGSASPLARVPGTHVARFVLLRDPERQVADQPADELGPHLMLSAFFDDDPERWLTALCEAAPDELDRAFGHCTAFPGDVRARGHAVRAWLAEHRVPATAIFGAYPDASVGDVRAALDFRARFREFAFGLESQRTAKAAFRAFDEAARG